MTRPKIVLPDIDVEKVRRFAESRVPAQVRDQVRLEVEVRGWTMTIVECRLPWREGIGPEWTRSPIARLRYDHAHQDWALCWRDRNQHFHLYDRIDPAPHVEVLLAEIDADPTAIFWG